jgi:hypothetical protein
MQLKSLSGERHYGLKLFEASSSGVRQSPPMCFEPLPITTLLPDRVFANDRNHLDFFFSIVHLNPSEHFMKGLGSSAPTVYRFEAVKSLIPLTADQKIAERSNAKAF